MQLMQDCIEGNLRVLIEVFKFRKLLLLLCNYMYYDNCQFLCNTKK